MGTGLVSFARLAAVGVVGVAELVEDRHLARPQLEVVRAEDRGHRQYMEHAPHRIPGRDLRPVRESTQVR